MTQEPQLLEFGMEAIIRRKSIPSVTLKIFLAQTVAGILSLEMLLIIHSGVMSVMIHCMAVAGTIILMVVPIMILSRVVLARILS